ncbi:MAG: hypothetical protein ACQEQO_03570 [Thermodesulfobacteriota bacterium]
MIGHCITSKKLEFGYKERYSDTMALCTIIAYHVNKDFQNTAVE